MKEKTKDKLKNYVEQIENLQMAFYKIEPKLNRYKKGKLSDLEEKELLKTLEDMNKKMNFDNFLKEMKAS